MGQDLVSRQTHLARFRRLLTSPAMIPLGMILLIASALVFGRKPQVDAAGRPIVVYAHPPCPPDLMVIYNQIFARFRQTHPGIDLKVLHITGQYQDKVKVMFAGNVAPDVIFMYPYDLPAWVAVHALVPLNSRLGPPSQSGYFAPMLEAFTVHGQIYGLPKDASAPVLFYNTELFRKYHVPVPNDHWTWQDLLAAARQLTVDTDGDGRINQWGLNAPEWQLLVWSFGGRILDASHTRCRLDRPEALAGLRFWADLLHKYHVVPPPEVNNDINAMEMFCLGRVAMNLQMYPAVSVFRKQADFPWDIAPVPRGPAGRVTQIEGSALAITSQCRTRRAAFTFIRWMTTTGEQMLASVEPPCYRDPANIQAFLDNQDPPAAKRVALEAMAYAHPPIQSPVYNQITDALSPLLNQAQRGEIPVAQAARQATRSVDQIISRYDTDHTHGE